MLGRNGWQTLLVVRTAGRVRHRLPAAAGPICDRHPPPGDFSKVGANNKKQEAGSQKN